MCLFNGAIRNTEDEHVAKMLRSKSKIMIAYGSCAYEGCIPGLANLFTMESILDRVYKDSPSTDNPQKVLPQATVTVPEGELELPRLHGTVRALHQIVDCRLLCARLPPGASDHLACPGGAVVGRPPGERGCDQPFRQGVV